jgi:plastocyanin
MHRRFLFAVLALAALSLAAVGCGGDDDEGNGGDNGGATDEPAATTPADGNGDGDGNGGGGEVDFDVSMTDNTYDPSEFTVPAGSEVTFALTNDGTAIHNMRIAGEDNEFNTDDDATSDLTVAAGATSEVEWTAPDEPGVYDFQCDFHLPDMAGTITVE